MSDGTHIPSWLRYLRVERGLQTSTLDAYERELRSAARCVAAFPLGTTTADLRSWLHRAGGSPSTVGKRIAALRSFFRWLQRTEQREDDPSTMLDRPRLRRGLPRPVEDLASRLLVLSPRMRSAALFFAETGLRLSEACAVDCPVPAPDALIVRGKGNKERLVPLTAAARAALDELGGRIGCSARTLEREFKAAGFTPHRLRHTFATELIRGGADIGDVQMLLGHSSPATTTIYAQYNEPRLRRAVERRERRSDTPGG